jgi:hypothetical protein
MEGHFRFFTKPQIGQLHRLFPQDAAGSSIPCLAGRHRGSTCPAPRRLPRLLPAKGRRLPAPPHAACPRILPALQDAAAGRPLPAPPYAAAGWALAGPHHAAAGHPPTARRASRLPVGRVVPFALWLGSSLEGLRLRVVPPENLTASFGRRGL